MIAEKSKDVYQFLEQQQRRLDLEGASTRGSSNVKQVTTGTARSPYQSAQQRDWNSSPWCVSLLPCPPSCLVRALNAGSPSPLFQLARWAFECRPVPISLGYCHKTRGSRPPFSSRSDRCRSFDSSPRATAATGDRASGLDRSKRGNREDMQSRSTYAFRMSPLSDRLVIA